MQDIRIGDMIIKKRGSERKFRVVRDFFSEPAENEFYGKVQFVIFLDLFYRLGYNKNRKKEVAMMCSKSQLNMITSRIARCAKDVFGDKLCSTLLYGSYARGDYDAESDIDIMVLADISREELCKYKTDFVRLTSELGLENDIVVTVTLKDKYTFEKYLEAVPFYQSVQREGIPIAV